MVRPFRYSRKGLDITNRRRRRPSAGPPAGQDGVNHLALRCRLINLGGCAITCGRNPDCQLFSEPALAVDDDNLYLHPPDGASGETLIAGPLLGARCGRLSGWPTRRRKPAR